MNKDLPEFFRNLDVYITLHIRGLPLITHAPIGGGGGVKPPIHLRITCKKKKGGGVQKACKNAYVINVSPLSAEKSYKKKKSD